MHRTYIALTLLACAALVAAPRSASAQVPAAGGAGGGFFGGHSDNPVGPTVSPYLNLLSTNQFGISNYHTLVKPLIEDQQAIQQQGAQLQRLQRDVQRTTSGGRSGTTGGIRATGLAPGQKFQRYQNLSHYYNFSSRR